MSRRNGRERWKAEAEMFASFVVAVKALGFTCYPESCGHDLVMVAPEVIPPEVSPHVRPGDLLVVEGKLVGSVEVLAQAMPPHVRHAREREMWPSAKVRPSAHWYVALVPEVSSDFRDMAWAVGVVPMDWTRHYSDRVRLDVLGRLPPSLRIEPGELLRLPELCVELTPGQPSPRRVTSWKVAAVRLCLLGRDGRTLTAEQVPSKMRRTFIDRGWLAREGRGNTAVFTLLESETRPDRAYPEIVAALVGQA